jgi:carboxymethylenebutenolidase
VVGSYGGKDPTLKGVGAKLEGILERNGVPHDIKLYPDAGHAFINDHSDDPLPVLIKVLARVSASAYHEPSAIDARRRIVAFFDRHLRDGATG